ncbi:MAG: TetR/AcrR family transcriptional regulator C-terminal domain-containing protein [Myxococcota bacterium]
MRRIARQARLGSHQNLYWYFPSKLELYRHTLGAFADRTMRRIEAEPPLQELPEVHLRRLARDFLRAFADEDLRTVVRLILNHLQLEAMQIPLEQSRPDNLYSRLAHYLAHQIALGRLRPHDPELSARMFFFQLWAHVNVRYFTPMLGPTPPPDDVFADFVVETFVRGLRP